MNISAIVISSPGKSYFKPKLCRELATLLNSTALIQAYPACSSLDAWVLVKADLNMDSQENQSAALDLTFGMATWIAIAIHAIGIEVYVSVEQEILRTTFTYVEIAASYASRGTPPPEHFLSAPA